MAWSSLMFNKKKKKFTFSMCLHDETFKSTVIIIIIIIYYLDIFSVSYSLF